MPRAVPVEHRPKSQPDAALPVAEDGHFDLNVQKVLEHWPVALFSVSSLPTPSTSRP